MSYCELQFAAAVAHLICIKKRTSFEQKTSIFIVPMPKRCTFATSQRQKG
ncbi:hypothetical protein HMPREF3226_02798 [Prevotella corporis]|uniref:Uncharacterized protein n=1 Tax=Prevotella corporis TaxID=28128 RepID=A0A133PT08_9BACT|nr:hypothetical protein HMPREF3226_02798 [Prevotella corporis]